MNFQDLKPGQHFMVATKGMRGHFACEMWMNNVSFNGDDSVFPEPWESDFMSWATKEEAVARAQKLAHERSIPFIV